MTFDRLFSGAREAADHLASAIPHGPVTVTVEVAPSAGQVLERIERLVRASKLYEIASNSRARVELRLEAPGRLVLRVR